YATVLALVVLGRDDEAEPLAEGLRAEPEEAFPRPVADALFGLAAADPDVYRDGVGRVLVSFEERDAHLEDIPVADTVMVLEALAARRDLAAGLSSPLLPDQ
ncbi:MAG: hypothetical protein ACRDLZ_07740, partial [Gaiellaceae bacterium]